MVGCLGNRRRNVATAVGPARVSPVFPSIPGCTLQLSTSISGFREHPLSFSRRRWILRRSNDENTTAMTPAAMQPIVRPVVCEVLSLLARLCSALEPRSDCGFRAVAAGTERCSSSIASWASSGTIMAYAECQHATGRTKDFTELDVRTVNNERGGVVRRSPVVTARPGMNVGARDCKGFFRRVERHQAEDLIKGRT